MAWAARVEWLRSLSRFPELRFAGGSVKGTVAELSVVRSGGSRFVSLTR